MRRGIKALFGGNVQTSTSTFFHEYTQRLNCDQIIDKKGISIVIGYEALQKERTNQNMFFDCSEKKIKQLNWDLGNGNASNSANQNIV